MYIPITDKAKYLGIIFDRKLSWHTNLQERIQTIGDTLDVHRNSETNSVLWLSSLAELSRSRNKHEEVGLLTKNIMHRNKQSFKDNSYCCSRGNDQSNPSRSIYLFYGGPER